MLYLSLKFPSFKLPKLPEPTAKAWIMIVVIPYFLGFFLAGAMNERAVEPAVAGAATQMFVPSARNPAFLLGRQETYYVSPSVTSKEEALQTLDVAINPEDEWQFFPDPALGVGSELTIIRATPVLIDNGGSRAYVRTYQSTVRDLLNEEGIEIGLVDQVDPGLDAELWWGGRVVITRVEAGIHTAIEDIRYDVQVREDSTKFRDEEQVIREGKRGKREVTVRFRKENGEEVTREVLSEKILAEPVTKVVRQGTKLRPATGRWEDLINEIAPRYGADPVGLTTIMMCESGGNLTSYNPAGPYLGMFQFDEYTFTNIAGHPMSAIYDARAQIDGAAKLYSARYWHWPVCSRGT